MSNSDHPDDTAELGDVLAVLPLRDIVVFPHMIVPLFVGREKSVRALEAVMKEDKQILLVAQKIQVLPGKNARFVSIRKSWLDCIIAHWIERIYFNFTLAGL